MEENNRKRVKRSSNFTKEEELLLIGEVDKFRKVIGCKTTDKVNNHEKICIQAWIGVASNFNSKGPSQARTVEQLKSKFENLKTKARKCAAENKGYLRGTGGGPSNESDWDPVVEAILRVINEKTVIGFHNPNDSDATVFDAAYNVTVDNIAAVNQNKCMEILLTYDEENEVLLPVEDFDIMENSSQLNISSRETEMKSAHTADDQTNLISDWSRYTPKKMKTPIPKKLRLLRPISNSLQTAKEEYYETKNKLLNVEIEQRNNEEYKRRKQLREEEGHAIKMKILN